ncbi:MAG: VCBS repeat-containing protein [Acidobacteriota bacterium]
MKRLQTVWCLSALLATGTFFLTGFHDAPALANSTAQTVPFAQNWSNTGLITVNDDWNAVPGIVGYLGDIATTSTTGVDPRTLLLDYSTVSAVDVIANQTNPDTLATGGVAEFEIPNATIALNGSGTADAPHIILNLNTTGQSGIQFTCSIRDLDASADDAIQQIDVQYRVGGTGNYASVPGGYIADATAAGTATMVTPISVTLPASANNQALVQVRIITTNAVGNDEWVGIDDISVTASPVVAVDAPFDFNGDGRTDWVVVRNVGGGGAGQLRWFWNINNSAAPTAAVDWGLNSDFLINGDFDGDLKDDIAVWRPDAALSAAFYILNSAGSTVRIERFGQTGDNPTVVADYNGDGTDDVAVYRPGAQSTWFFRTTPNGAVSYIPWGTTGDVVAPGDWNGDGTADFGVQRPNASSGDFWIRLSNGTVQPVQSFGSSTDFVVTGDFDGDAKTDLATGRAVSGAIVWFWRPSGGGADQQVQFGLVGDIPAPGDYDGDGKTDVAVFRSGVFYARSTTSGAVSYFSLGAAGDRVPATYNTH